MVHDSAKIESVESSGQKQHVAVALFATAVFLFWFSQYIYVPTLPTFVQARTTDLGVVGLVLAMYGLWQGLIRLPLGIVSDWVGRRKPFILGGIACSAIGAWIMVSSTGVEGLALGRGVTGLAAASWVPLVVAFSSLFPPNEAVRASALVAFFASLGRVVATALAGPLGAWGGYEITFTFAIAFSAFAIIVLLPIQEDRNSSDHRPASGGVRKLMIRRDVMLPSALAAVGQYVNWAISYGFLAIRVTQLAGDGIAQGLSATVLLVMVVLGNLVSSSIVDRFGLKRLLNVSFALLALGTLWAAFSPTLLLLFVAPAFLGSGIGIAGPILMGLSIQDVTDSERTTAMGIHQTIYAIGMFAGPALSGAVVNLIGFHGMFAVTALTCLVLGLVGTSFVRERQNAYG